MWLVLTISVTAVFQLKTEKHTYRYECSNINYSVLVNKLRHKQAYIQCLVLLYIAYSGCIDPYRSLTVMWVPFIQSVQIRSTKLGRTILMYI